MRKMCLIGLLGFLLGLVACRDRQKDCQEYAQKYQQCLMATYKEALQAHKKLPPQQARRGLPFLQKLKAQLHSGKLQQKYYHSCIKSPPSRSQLRCVARSRCQDLRLCRVKPSS